MRTFITRVSVALKFFQGKRVKSIEVSRNITVVWKITWRIPALCFLGQVLHEATNWGLQRTFDSLSILEEHLGTKLNNIIKKKPLLSLYRIQQDLDTSSHWYQKQKKSTKKYKLKNKKYNSRMSLSVVDVVGICVNICFITLERFESL